MSIMTSVVRPDKNLRHQNSASVPASDANYPIPAIEKMRSCLRDFSDAELETLEDELDFCAFTGIAGNLVKKLLLAVRPG